ncbi:hypothetical protein SSS_10015 [Sarcoptes scabiei]|nr:hypothetical protein SSS_10015 [Sarcoptes scabiei]
MKLMYEDLPDKDDLMGNDDSVVKVSKSVFNIKSPSMKHRSNVFSLGDRENLLGSEPESPSIVAHLAIKNDIKYPMETIFGKFNTHYWITLVANICSSMNFL